MAENPIKTLTLENGGQHDTGDSTVNTIHPGAPVNPHTVDWTEIFKRCGDQPAESAVLRILNDGVPVSSYDVDGKTALHLAAKHKDIKVAKLLIDRGADVNAPRKWPTISAFEKRPAKSSWLWTPLQYATKRDDADMIQLLIDAGADVGANSSIRETALNVAYRERTVSAVWLLHQHGATSNETQYTPGINDPLPPWLRNRMHRSNEPRSIITQLEKEILQTVLQSMGELQVHGDWYCDRCRASFELDPITKDRSSRTFGYIKRCEICTASLITARGALAPSRILLETTPSVFKTKTLEEDLEYILAAAEKTPDDSTGSDIAFTFVKYWLLRCLKSHGSCEGLSEEPPELPTRVIDVGVGDSPPSPVLYESKAGERGYYFALSYRWIPFTVITKKMTLPHFRKSLYWRILPPVIQDAIKIAIKFGIRYLWVDAFCIVQDDEEDWARESQTMHEIYRNALLTIGVVGSTSRTEGIFRPRNGQEVRKTPRRRPHGILDTRGWTIQEQYLSPRLLSYTTDQLFWDCLHFSASESCPNGVPAYVDEDHRDEHFRSSRTLVINSNFNFEHHDRVYWLWRKLLGEYTGRQLSKETDRLAAIRGISSSFSKKLDDMLLAGIWTKKLVRHLAWWVEPGRLSSGQRNDCVSWSWLSRTSAVTYESILDYQTTGVAQRVQIDAFTEQARVFDASCIDELWRTAYSTGQLLLRGHLFKVFSFDSTAGTYLIPERYLDDLKSELDPGYHKRLQSAHFSRSSLGLTEQGIAEQKALLHEAVADWLSTQYPPPHTRGCEIWYPDQRFSFCQGSRLFAFVLGTSSTGHVYSLVLAQTNQASFGFRRVGLCAWNPGNVAYLQGLYRTLFSESGETISLY